MKFVRISFALTLTLLLVVGYAHAQEFTFDSPDPDQPVGLTVTSDAVSDGYILLSLIQSQDILLLSNDGRIVNKWGSDYYAGQAAYLLPNGDLLRTSSLTNAYGPTGQWGYVNGLLEEYNWDGDLVWSFEMASDRLVGHHDIEPMPNGHVLMVYFEKFTREEAIAAGRNPDLISDENQLWGEAIYEIDPTTNEVVWEWHVWDHLVQDYDAEAANYGVVADHPERINLNYLDPEQQPNADWLHFNSVEYNEELDQIIVSPRTYSEIWVIDHNTTTEEATGPAGDLLYRWGNPATYDVGTPEDRPLYFQHDPTWIPDGYPGAGNILIFDNGSPARPYSRIVEIAIPADESGNYIMNPGEATTPEIVWQYETDPPEDFFSVIISGAQRQPNGNTLITDGVNSRMFEVATDGTTVWEYYLPPATWIFRGERYDLSGFDFDLSGDLGFEGGEIWHTTCQDGSEPYLYAYQINDGPVMTDYIDQYGGYAQAYWAEETCADYGGVAN